MKCIVCLFIVIGVSCTNQIGRITNMTNKYTFNLSTVTSEFENTKRYEINLPKGGKIKKLYPQNGKLYTEYRVSYLDGSIFYITNDIWNGSMINAKNLIDIGVIGHTKQSLLDTISFTSDKAPYWKEQFIGEIVVGYTTAIIKNRIEFERAIKGLIEN